MNIRRLIYIFLFLFCFVSFSFLYSKQLGAVSCLLLSILFFNMAYYQWKQAKKAGTGHENKDKD